jgi:flavin reductase ActVB
MLDAGSFKRAMSRFPSGVVIATALDARGRPWGFTATSFASVSLDPPLVLVCPAKTADCHGVFTAAGHFAINILASDHEAEAQRFATRGVDKFAGDEFDVGEHALPLLRTAIASLVCRTYAQHDAGDHTLLLGQVTSVRLGPASDPVVYYRRQYWHFAKDKQELHSAGLAE